MEDILFEDCDIAVRHYPILYQADPGVMLGSLGNTIFRNISIKAHDAIRLLGTGDSPVCNVTFENVTGTLRDSVPLRMESVRGITFKDFSVTGGLGKKHPMAVGGKCTW